MSNIATIEPRPNVTAGHQPMAIVPQSMDEAYRLSVAIHKSGLAPYGMETPEKVMVALMCGLELGLKPMQAIQRIAVINGRPTIFGDAAIGLVRSSGLCEWIKETTEGEGDERKAVCLAKRKGDPEVIRGEFSVADAKVAKLWGKTGPKGPTPWVTHPDRMLKMRARGFALRDGFADILSGLYLHEELEGEAIDVTPAIPKPPVPPSPPKVAPVEPAIPVDALSDFDAFHRALDYCPTLDSLNATFEALTKNMHDPSDLEEAQNRLREVASRFPVEDGE